MAEFSTGTRPTRMSSQRSFAGYGPADEPHAARASSPAMLDGVAWARPVVLEWETQARSTDHRPIAWHGLAANTGLESMKRYDPLKAPDPQEWLSLDELDRIRLA